MSNFTSRALLSLALAGAAGLIASTSSAGGGAGPFVAELPIVPISERWVCDLNDQPGALAADIQGQDGGVSLLVGATSYWFFGDTEYTGSPWKNIRNNIAYTTGDTDASDCVTLTHKAALNPQGVNQAQPLLSGTVAWPAGPAVLQDGFVHFYWLEADPQLQLRGVGIARFSTSDPEGERLNGGQFVWDNALLGNLNLGVASSVLVDDPAGGEPYLYVFFNSTRKGPDGVYTDVLLGRVPASCTDLDCPAEGVANYEYWSPTVGWTADLGAAEALWQGIPAHNGPNVAYNSSLGKWTAVYAIFPPLSSSDRPSLRMRVADQPQGPWSDSNLVVDCLEYHHPSDGFVCYSAAQHPEFAANGGRTQYVSFSTNYGSYPNRVYHEEIHEVQLAAPVWQCDTPSGKEYVVHAAGCAKPEGIAFYAIDPATGPSPDGFAAISRWTNQSTAEVTYASDAPAGSDWTPDAKPAFYVPDPDAIDIRSFAYDPVYRWHDPADPSRRLYSPLPQPGLDSQFAFAALCPDSDGDRRSDCREAFEDAAWPYPDSDGDGCDDARELGRDAVAGGRRSTANFWDFFDTPHPKDGRDQRVSIADVTGVLSRFGARGDPAVDPHATPPPPPSYHPAFDRRGNGGVSDPWDLRPPDGAVSIVDVFLVASQFGHHCAG